MFKLLQLRLLAAAAFCLLLTGSAYGGPVTISFGENAGAFSLTIVGGAVNRELVTSKQLGASWEVLFTIKEQDNPNSSDIMAVKVTVRHIMAPHGEVQGQLFTFDPGAAALIGNGMVTQSSTIPLNHGSHVDNYQAVLTFSVVNGQITGYRLHVEGRHCIGNDCPQLPNEVEIPEPATMLLLGTGLVGLAVKTRKRLKRRGGFLRQFSR